MARLNDLQPISSAPLESVDALKRRFIRQNREIARANSTQSLRIRNLEAETSRLLSENIALREQVIKLQYEVDRNSNRRTLRNVDLVRGQLEAKLAELGSLVLELGNVKSNRRSSTSPVKDYVERKSPKRSPDQRNWKNALTLSDVTRGQDGRLPAIMEDKLYPRKTLDPSELLGVFHGPTNMADSPDFGPPPVAHFEGDGDPIKYDAAHSDHEEVPTIKGFANLETRKKRRESSIGREIARLESLELEPASTLSALENTVEGQLKSGAKRKLGVREEENHNGSNVDREKGAFRPNRREETLNRTFEGAAQNPSTTGNAILDVKTSREQSGIRVPPQEKFIEGMSLPNARRALGEKTVNTDPIVSPAKPAKTGTNEKLGDSKKDASKKPQDRDQREKSIAPKVIRISERRIAPKVVPIDLPSRTVELPPVTPAPPDLNLMSPLSTEPSAPRPESRDTPPPEDLCSDNLTTTGRPTRRPRGNVSYAEPNLRDKMRRPTKDLVDAVGADERIQRAASVKTENEKEGADEMIVERANEKETTRTVFVKEEEDENSWPPSWKNLPVAQIADENDGPAPTSPLGTKSSSSTSSAHLPPTVITSRKRRPSSFPAVTTSPPSKSRSQAPSVPNPISTSASTIAALAAIPHRPTSRFDNPSTRQAGQALSNIHNTTDTTILTEAPPAKPNKSSDIYEFRVSSPTEAKHVNESQHRTRESGAVEESKNKSPPRSQPQHQPQTRKLKESRRSISVPDSLGAKLAMENGRKELVVETGSCSTAVVAVRGGGGGERTLNRATEPRPEIGTTLTAENFQDVKEAREIELEGERDREGATESQSLIKKKLEQGRETRVRMKANVRSREREREVMESTTSRREKVISRRRSGVL